MSSVTTLVPFAGNGVQNTALLANYGGRVREKVQVGERTARWTAVCENVTVDDT